MSIPWGPESHQPFLTDSHWKKGSKKESLSVVLRSMWSRCTKSSNLGQQYCRTPIVSSQPVRPSEKDADISGDRSLRESGHDATMRRKMAAAKGQGFSQIRVANTLWTGCEQPGKQQSASFPGCQNCDANLLKPSVPIQVIPAIHRSSTRIR